MRDLKIESGPIDRSEASLNAFLKEISKIPVLTPEQEVAMFRDLKNYKEGSPEYEKIINDLVKANLRFVVSVAKKYQSQANVLSLMDLINEGSMGLKIAAEKFDTTKGFKFISYAVWWIRASIEDAISKTSKIIRMPRNQTLLINEIERIVTEFEHANNRTPDDEEIYQFLKEKQPTLKKDSKKSKLQEESIKPAIMFWRNKKHLSLDKTLSEESDQTFSDVTASDTPSPDQDLIKESLKKEIAGLLTNKQVNLSPKQIQILKLYFGIDQDFSIQSYEAIGSRFDPPTSDEAVRKALKAASKKIKQYLEKNPKKRETLKGFLG